MLFIFASTDVIKTPTDPTIDPTTDPTTDPTQTLVNNTSVNLTYNNWKDILNLSLSTFFLGFLGFFLFFVFDVDISAQDHSTSHIIPYNSYMFLFIWPLITLLIKYIYSSISFSDYAFFFMFDFTLTILATGSLIPVFGVSYMMLSDDTFLKNVMKKWSAIFFGYAFLIWMLFCTLFSIFAYFIYENISFFSIVFFICLFWHIFIITYGLKNRDRTNIVYEDPDLFYENNPPIWTRRAFHHLHRRFDRFNNWKDRERKLLKEKEHKERQEIINKFDPDVRKQFEENQRIKNYKKQPDSIKQLEHNLNESENPMKSHIQENLIKENKPVKQNFQTPSSFGNQVINKPVKQNFQTPSSFGNQVINKPIKQNFQTPSSFGGNKSSKKKK